MFDDKGVRQDVHLLLTSRNSDLLAGLNSIAYQNSGNQKGL